VAEDFDDRIRDRLREFVLELRGLTEWVIGPPQFVDMQEEVADSSPGDFPVETLGAYLELYTAVKPWTLPRDIDVQHLEEVRQVVSAVCRFSEQCGVVFEFELDGTFVGVVENGAPDKTLKQGLLEAWERQLGL